MWRGGRIRICDIGCGKGRYLKKLSKAFPDIEYYATDLSANVMEDIHCTEEKRVGRLTQIPYADETFDLVYVCEALEHAINLEGALKELYRIIKNRGVVCIIDKPIEKLGQLQIYEWEQWIDDNSIKNFVKGCRANLEIVESVPYEDKDDGLFKAWIIRK